MKHILMVDDDALMLSMMSRALPEYQLSIARDGGEAMAIALRTRIDLLITDYLMPSMTGDELVGRLRASQPGLKALVVTGHGVVLSGELPEWWETVAHLDKPFHIDALRDAVIGLIGLPA